MRIETHNPIEAFERRIQTLRHGGLTLAEADREVQRSEPDLVRRYQRAQRGGHPGALTVRPGDGPLTLR